MEGIGLLMFAKHPLEYFPSFLVAMLFSDFMPVLDDARREIGFTRDTFQTGFLSTGLVDRCTPPPKDWKLLDDALRVYMDATDRPGFSSSVWYRLSYVGCHYLRRDSRTIAAFIIWLFQDETFHALINSMMYCGQKQFSIVLHLTDGPPFKYIHRKSVGGGGDTPSAVHRNISFYFV